MTGQTTKPLQPRRAAIYPELPCAAILGVAFVLFACLSWRTWPDILVDFGQELYVPWRLSVGEVLYRDVAWVTGPLSEYVNSLLFRLFGVSLTTLIAANLALLASIVATLYWLFRQCGTRWSATFVGLFFLAVFAFAQYSLIGNYNYVCPYRHDMTHGLVLGLANLVCLIEFARTHRMRWLVGAGLCLGLLTLAKIEMVLAAFLTTAAALPLFAWREVHAASEWESSTKTFAISRLLKLTRRTAYWAGLIAASAGLPVATAVAALARPLGWAESVRQIFQQYRLALAPELSTGSRFYREISGSDRIAENLTDMAFAAVVVLAAVVVGYAMEMALGRSKWSRVWAILLGVGTAYGGLAFVPREEWEALPACLPLLLLPVILLALRRALREPKGTWSAAVLYLVAVYGVSLLPKIMLKVRWSHYGFVLAVPGTLVLIHVAQHTIPAWLSTSRRNGWCFRGVTAGLLAACVILLVQSWLRIDGLKTTTVGEGGDKFYAEPYLDGRVVPTVNTLAYLREQLRPDDTLIVFPNGVMLNYQLRARNPTRFIMYNPWESDVHGGEKVVADTVIGAAPDYAVIVTMDMEVHGRGNFGDPDFGGRIRIFLDEHYDVVHEQVSEGGIGGRYVSTVFKRRAP